MKTSRQQDLCQNDLLPTIKLLLLQTNVKNYVVLFVSWRNTFLASPSLGFLVEAPTLAM